MPKLILARHGVTPYNEKGIWTGLTDVDMSEGGYREVERGADILAKYTIDIALSSVLKRARNTAKVILAKQVNPNIPLLETALLNEKDYGVFTGKNKQRVKEEVGEEEFMQIRRSWDYRIEQGQSLQDIHAHGVVPVHRNVTVPLLEAGKTVLVSSHNNTLRAYVKELEAIPDDQASAIELGTAEIRIYDFYGGDFSIEATHVIGAVH